ncbi:MAG: restriction endonuclease subunit S [Paludibacteraceae bacterium]|nr:restriction endonuclease subunit S [Paludibacteraceae bacterium]
MDTSTWKWFRYDEIFDIRKGKRLTKENMTEGNIRYIGAIDSNNGLSAFIGNDSQLHQGNTITVSYNGSIGYAFYQDKEFWATDDVNVLYPRFSLNRYIAMFLCHLIEMEQYRFCYGRKWDLEAMNKSKIKLPVTQEGTPDWKYMDDFVKDQIIPQLPKKAQRVWLQKYDTTPQKQENMKLNTQDWKYYTIRDLFRVELTKGDIKADEVDSGNIPLISSGEGNNGVVKYISKEGDGKAEMFPDNTITLDMFCHANYQRLPYYAVGHGRVNILFPKFELNKYIGIFICTLINREVYRFSYGRAVYSTVAEKMRIKLPVTPSGEPDWQFMEDYIKSLPFSRNIEPSKPNEVVDEVIEMKKELIKMRKQLEAQQASQEVKIIGGNVTYIDNSKNYNIQK